MASFPRIAFGIIVLNGEPFMRYCLRQIYPFAHQIIVVEGAVEGARHAASLDGHSVDGTLDVLRAFQRDEDPDRKIEIVTREGFWSEKDEMSQAYAERATGDYLWQVDVDEFYTRETMQKVVDLLAGEPAIAAVSFPILTFWGAPDVICDGLYLRTFDPGATWNPSEIHRIFRWGPGYRYLTHRPPTVVDASGRDPRLGARWVRAREARSLGLVIFHYSLLFPRQVSDKSAYYGQLGYSSWVRSSEWAAANYEVLKHPFHVHNAYRWPSWLRPYRGPWPEQVAIMWRDITAGKLATETRPMGDARTLMAGPLYRLAGFALSLYAVTLHKLFVRAWGAIHRVGLLRHFRRLGSRRRH